MGNPPTQTGSRGIQIDMDAVCTGPEYSLSVDRFTKPLTVQPIPYQGSKRRLAPAILSFFPRNVCTLFEPFCGSAALSLAAAHDNRAQRFVLNDSLVSLTGIWQAIVSDPQELADNYERIWEGQHTDPNQHYFDIRAQYNRAPSPAQLLYLITRCVKNAIRFNDSGEFNQSPDRRRRGMNPDRMRNQLRAAHAHLSGRTKVRCGDFQEVLAAATPYDLVYFDPPYQGTSNRRDRRYRHQLDRDRLIRSLADLRSRGIPMIVSFDGRHGSKSYGDPLPEELGLVHYQIDAGRSSQATLLGQNRRTLESLYVSPKLGRHLG